MQTDDPLIVVVGVCASGKSLLVSKLQERNYRARCVAQEHSYAPKFWAKMKPDFLVVLDCSIETVRKRRSVPWGEERLIEQRKRIQHAREHCQLYLLTDHLTPDEVLERVITAVEEHKLRRRKTIGGEQSTW